MWWWVKCPVLFVYRIPHVSRWNPVTSDLRGPMAPWRTRRWRIWTWETSTSTGGWPQILPGDVALWTSFWKTETAIDGWIDSISELFVYMCVYIYIICRQWTLKVDMYPSPHIFRRHGSLSRRKQGVGWEIGNDPGNAPSGCEEGTARPISSRGPSTFLVSGLHYNPYMTWDILYSWGLTIWLYIYF